MAFTLEGRAGLAAAWAISAPLHAYLVQPRRSAKQSIDHSPHTSAILKQPSWIWTARCGKRHGLEGRTIPIEHVIAGVLKNYQVRRCNSVRFGSGGADCHASTGSVRFSMGDDLSAYQRYEQVLPQA